jgi:tRNA(Ile2) C34 agmatinyltransferase TiaS
MLRHQYENIQLANLPNDEKLQYIENKFQDDFYGWVRDGYVKVEGKDYIVSINYQQGKLQVNGKSM